MSKIALEGNASGTGTFTIASPNSNSNYTLTLPSSTGTVVVTGGAQTIEFAAGTAAAPSITFTGDTNTGIFSPGADTIAFSEGGAEAMRIDSSGKLLVGTTTATLNTRLNAKLGVVSTGSGEYGGAAITSYSGTTAAAGSFIDFNRSRGTTDGSVTKAESGDTLGYLVFRGSDGTNFVDSSLIKAEVDGATGANDMPGRLAFYTSADGSASPTERARITSGGDLLVGATTSSGKITSTSTSGNTAVAIVDTSITAAGTETNYLSFFGTAANGTLFTTALARIGAVSMFGTEQRGSLVFQTTPQNGSPTERMKIWDDGSVQAGGVYSYVVGATNRDVYVDNSGYLGYVSSLRESKKEIQDLTDTSWIYQLNPVSFKYRKKDEKGNFTDETDGNIQYGMIAEDVEQVRPDLCFYDEVNGIQELRGVQYSKLIPVLLKALQEAMTRIEALEAEVAALKGQ